MNTGIAPGVACGARGCVSAPCKALGRAGWPGIGSQDWLPTQTPCPQDAPMGATSSAAAEHPLSDAKKGRWEEYFVKVGRGKGALNGAAKVRPAASAPAHLATSSC